MSSEDKTAVGSDKCPGQAVGWGKCYGRGSNDWGHTNGIQTNMGPNISVDYTDVESDQSVKGSVIDKLQLVLSTLTSFLFQDKKIFNGFIQIWHISN